MSDKLMECKKLIKWAPKYTQIHTDTHTHTLMMCNEYELEIKTLQVPLISYFISKHKSDVCYAECPVIAFAAISMSLFIYEV